MGETMKFCMKLLKKYGCWLFLGLMIVVTVFMDVYIAHHILDSDTSEDLYHGWIIAQQNNPFTRDVYPSTEIRLLDIATVFSLFFHFTSDWTLVRILGTITMQAYYVVSFLFLCSQAGLSRKHAVFSAGLLLLPFSVPYARIVLYHLYYILYFANAFWIMGLTLYVFHAWPAQKRKAFVASALLAALWLFVGLNGIRHMMILGIPMLTFAGIRLLLTLQEYRWEDGRLLGTQPIWHSEAFRLLIILVCSFVFFLIGYALNTSILLPYFQAMDSSSASFRPIASADHYTRIFNGWMIASGSRHSVLDLVGLRGLSLIASLFGFGYLLVVSFKNCFEKGALAPKLMHSMLGISFATTTLIFVFESAWRYYDLYYVPVVFLAASALAQEIGKWKDQCVTACRKLLIALTCICFLFQGAYTVYYLTVDRWDMDTWNGLMLTELNTAEKAATCAEQMKEHGYTHGMIDYWYANVMMELTDGELIMAPLNVVEEKDVILKVYPWGTSRTAFNRENLPDKIIAFIQRNKAPAFEERYPQAVYKCENYSFIGYEVSADEIGNTQR